jgi:hypothetical protein
MLHKHDGSCRLFRHVSGQRRRAVRNQRSRTADLELVDRILREGKNKPTQGIDRDLLKFLDLDLPEPPAARCQPSLNGIFLMKTQQLTKVPSAAASLIPRKSWETWGENWSAPLGVRPPVPSGLLDCWAVSDTAMFSMATLIGLRCNARTRRCAALVPAPKAKLRGG